MACVELRAAGGRGMVIVCVYSLLYFSRLLCVCQQTAGFCSLGDGQLLGISDLFSTLCPPFSIGSSHCTLSKLAAPLTRGLPPPPSPPPPLPPPPSPLVASHAFSSLRSNYFRTSLLQAVCLDAIIPHNRIAHIAVFL